ncbi:MAG: hypothetical protein JSW40_02385 [Candidatus Omnitrophota bacterium]|nr:MAG: hypothetical protein JSW40_02385 [Candidatus Omnitrophota bacterium]
MSKSNKWRVASNIINIITLLVTAATSIIISIVRVRLLEIYKELYGDFNSFPALVKFLSSVWGNLSFVLFCAGVFIFLIIKESRVSSKKLTLMINIIALIIVILVFLFYAGGLMMAVFTDGISNMR